MLKRPALPDDFQGNFLEATFRVSVEAYRTSLVAQTVNRMPTMWETRFQSLGREDSPGERNGNPLQFSCL